MDLQSEYNNPSQQQSAPADPSQGGQDLTIPAAAAAQLVQAIQQQDCAGIIKILTTALGGDNDGDEAGAGGGSGMPVM